MQILPILYRVVMPIVINKYNSKLILVISFSIFPNMGNLTEFLILCNCLTLISAIALSEYPKPHQHLRNVPQKCDLICPGQQPLPLPPNFIQNSTCVSTTTSTSTTPRSTTAKSTKTTTESSSEEESTEEESSERSNKTRRQRKNKHAKKPHLKNKIRKETVILKRQGKSHIFKHNKALKEKARLDGCYVICSDNNGVAQYPDASESASESEESDDNYVAGEDTPIEIIYVPGNTNNRPSDVYQINNYELIDPDPFSGFGYDPWFRRGKHRNIKKKQHHTKKKHKSSKRKSQAKPKISNF